MTKLRTREKLCYGVGTLGFSLEANFVSVYLVLFATDVLGISAVLIGGILLIPKVLDILSDFLIMNRVDRTRTRFGTYRPWLFSAVPLAVCMVLVFHNPIFLPGANAKALYLVIVYFLMVTIFETAYWCPFATMSGVISSDKGDRLGLTSIRSAFENVAVIFASVIFVVCTTRIGTSQKDPVGWKYATGLLAVIGVVAMLICFFGTRERVGIGNGTAGKERIALKSDEWGLITRLKWLIHSRKLRGLIFLMFVLLLPWYVYGTLASYFIIYNMGNESLITVFAILGVGVAVATAGLVPRLAKRMQGRRLLVLGTLCMLAAAILFLFVRTVPMMAVFVVVKDFGQTLLYVSIFSYAPAIADELGAQTGNNVSGLVFGCISSFQKAAIAIGGFLATVVLSVGGYDGGLVIQSDRTLCCIRYGIAIAYAVCMAVILCFLGRRPRGENA